MHIGWSRKWVGGIVGSGGGREIVLGGCVVKVKKHPDVEYRCILGRAGIGWQCLWLRGIVGED